MTELFSQPPGASPISDEQKEGLLQRWVSSQEELNLIEQTNIYAAQNWLFDSRQKDATYANIEFLINLHTRMLDDVYSWAGQIRKTDSNIGIDPHLIRQAVVTLKHDLETWINDCTYPEDEIAIRYHHRLVCIHPFVNGNGRHSRLMADYINEQVFNNAPFTWGSDTLYIQGKARSTYMEAIYQANDHNIQPLVDFARNNC